MSVKNLPLVIDIAARDSDTNEEAKIKNGYVDPQGRQFPFVVKRPGTNYQGTTMPVPNTPQMFLNYNGTAGVVMDSTLYVVSSEFSLSDTERCDFTAGYSPSLEDTPLAPTTLQGRKIVGFYYSTAGNTDDFHGFLWQEGNVTDLGTLGGFTSEANSITADGTVIVGVSATAESTGYDITKAFRYVNGIMSDLGTLGGDRSVAWDISEDGTIIVGMARNATDQQRAFRWTQAGGMVDLGTLGGTNSWAYGISADGSTIVGPALDAGFAVRAYKWTQAGGMVALAGMESLSAEANAVSSDGSVVVGFYYDGIYQKAFRWTLADGYTDLGTLGGTEAVAFDVSDDGTTVVGSSRDSSNNVHAFRWTAATGMVDLTSSVVSPQVGRIWGIASDGVVSVGETDSQVAVYKKTSGTLTAVSNLNSTAIAYAVSGSMSGTTWVSTTTYNINDSVIYNFTTYYSITDSNTGNTPTTSPEQWTTTVPVTYATFDPGQTFNATLANGNKTLFAAHNAGGTSKATIGVTSESWYWETTRVTAWSGADVDANVNTIIGIYYGAGTIGLSYRGMAGLVGYGTIGSIDTVLDGVTPPAVGETVAISFDFATGILHFYKGGVDLVPAGIDIGVPASILPQVEIDGDTITANFGQSAFVYTPPTGHNSGIYTQG